MDGRPKQVRKASRRHTEHFGSLDKCTSKCTLRVHQDLIYVVDSSDGWQGRRYLSLLIGVQV